MLRMVWEMLLYFTVPDKSGEDLKLAAMDKLGELLSHLTSMKKYPSVLTSDVLQATQEVIVKVKGQ